MDKEKKVTHYRDAKTGQYTTKENVKNNPSTTVTEKDRVKSNPKSKPKKKD